MQLTVILYLIAIGYICRPGEETPIAIDVPVARDSRKAVASSKAPARGNEKGVKL
jgi:hypothetical protein